MYRGKTKHGLDIKSTQGMKNGNGLPLWVVVADQSRARIYEHVKEEEFRSVMELLNPEGKMKPSRLTTDRPGRSFDSFSRNHHGQTGNARHAYSSELNPHQKVVEDFVGKIAEALKSARKNSKFGKLVLVASSQLLGSLGQHLAGVTWQKIIESHDRDYAWLQEHELLQRLVPFVVPASDKRAQSY